MRKCQIILFFILLCSVQLSLFAGGSRETPARHNVYGKVGASLPSDVDTGVEGAAIGLGYEAAIGDSFSLGGYAGITTGDDIGFDLLLKPRFYFSSSLEKFFIGANLGLGTSTYSTGQYDYYGNEVVDVNADFVAGLNLGYKFVFGSGSSGFSLEPSGGYDFLPGRVSLGIAFGFAFGGNAGTTPEPRAAPVRNADTGAYLGIIGFNEKTYIKPLGIISDRNENEYRNFIERELPIKAATGLYFAVDTAVDMLQKANLPNDLVNVAVVTFTDGLDNFSIELNTNYRSRDAYRDAMNSRLINTKIKNLPINAYSIGVKGGDVADEQAFRIGLEKLASDTGKVNNVDNMSAVRDTFRRIADDLYKVFQFQSIRLRIPGGFDDGDRIRFTFDIASSANADASRSNFYIEGTFSRNGTSRILQDVVYKGLDCSSGTRVVGSLESGYVTFTFKDAVSNVGGTINTANAQQFIYLASQSRWQRNSEFNPTEDSHVEVEQKSAAVILVLDCTSSLDADGARGSTLMKQAANAFIDALLGK